MAHYLSEGADTAGKTALLVELTAVLVDGQPFPARRRAAPAAPSAASGGEPEAETAPPAPAAVNRSDFLQQCGTPHCTAVPAAFSLPFLRPFPDLSPPHPVFLPSSLDLSLTWVGVQMAVEVNNRVTFRAPIDGLSSVKKYVVSDAGSGVCNGVYTKTEDRDGVP